MSLATFGMSVEDAINKRSVHYLKNRGWLPRTIGLMGYGSERSLHVMGRVVMADPGEEPEPDDEDDLTDYPTGHQSRETRSSGTVLKDTVANAQRGWRQFFTAQVGFLPVTVRAGGQVVHSTTDRGGYIDVMVRDHGLAPGWHEVIIEAKAAQPVTAKVLVVASDVTTGIISDIDDTIMVTMLPRAVLAAWNSFVRYTNTRKPVPGMSELYEELRRDRPDTPVFYLSTGAWNVVPTLRSFMHRHNFPAGPMLMTDWGPTPTGLFRSGREHKRVQLRNLMITYPHIRWILVGDDGQHDPTIYDEVAREHPHNVAAIAIRELTATEQVLAHGTTEPVEIPKEARSAMTEHGVPTVYGPNGYSLASRLPSIAEERFNNVKLG